MKYTDYNRLANSDEFFYCPLCSDRLPNLNDSFFLDGSISESSSISRNSSVISDGVISPFNELQEARGKHTNKFLVAHVNINILKSKFMEIYELLNDKIVDLLFISETKLDGSFRDFIFDVPGYKLEQKDRNLHGGGVAAFIRSDIPARRRKDLESQNLENITLEVTLNKTNQCFLCVYRPPDFPGELLGNDLSKTLDKCLTLYDHYAIFGDLNYDLLSDVKKRPLTDLWNFSA